MSEAVIISLISAGFPVVATTITALLQRRSTEKLAAKQSIMQMILEDHVAVSEGHLPTNYQNILHEYDIYHRNGGNSYVKKKVDEYIDWFNGTEKKISRGRK